LNTLVKACYDNIGHVAQAFRLDNLFRFIYTQTRYKGRSGDLRYKTGHFNKGGRNTLLKTIIFSCLILLLLTTTFQPVIAQENNIKETGATSSPGEISPSPVTTNPESAESENKQSSAQAPTLTPKSGDTEKAPSLTPTHQTNSTPEESTSKDENKPELSPSEDEKKPETSPSENEKKGEREQKGASVFTLAKKLFREGRFIQAKRILMDAEIPDKESKRQESFIAIADYTAPDWYPGDYSQIEKYRRYTIPLMLDIIGSSPGEKIPRNQKAWINLARIKFMKLTAQIAPEKAVPVMIKRLDDSDVQVRLNAINILGGLGNKRAVKPLLNYLKEEHIPDYSAGNVEMQVNLEKQAQASAIGAIVTIRDFSIVPDLKKDLEKTGTPEYKTAATILTGYQSPQFLDFYMKLLKSDEPAMKIFAASALKSLGYDDGLPVLKKMFDEGSIMQCLQLFDTIAWWRNADVAKFFSEYLNKKSTGMKFGYIPLSRQGKYPDLSMIIDPEELLYLKIILKLTQWKKITPPVVFEMMKDKKGNFRYIGTEIVGEDRYKPALDYFRRNVDSEDPLMKYYSIWAMGRMGDKKSSGKITKLLEDKDKHISVASAWSLSVMGDDRGHDIALKEIDNSDNSISSTALDIIYRLRKPGDVEKVAELLNKKLSYFDRITIIRLMGIYKNSQYLEKIKELTGERSPFSFYAAESAYRISREPVKMKKPPENRGYYGNGVYDAIDYARYLLLYFSLKPGEFGRIGDCIYGDITPLYRYGEFGVVEDKSPANPLQKIVGGTSGTSGELFPGETMVIKEFKGRKALVSLPDGREGWTFSAGMDITRDVISKTRERMRNDLGCRWDNDFTDIIERDYLGDKKFDVRYTDPVGAEASIMIETALNMGYMLTGEANVPEEIWKEVIKKTDKGKKIIETEAPVAGGRWIFTFDCLGNLQSFNVTR